MAKTNAFEKVTNLTEQAFTLDNGNGTYSDMCEVLKKRHTPECVKVYSFKLASCSVSEKLVNLNYKHIDTALFTEAFLRYWYALEKESIEQEYKKYNFNDIPEALQARAEVVKARYDNAMEVLAGYGNVSGIPETVKLLVLCIRKAKEEKFDDTLRKDFATVVKVLKKLNELDNDDKKDKTDVLHTVELRKELRQAIDKNVCKHIWKSTECGTIKKHIFHCNARLAESVYRVAEIGEAINGKTGKWGTVYADSGMLIREIIAVCFKSLQVADEPANNEEAAK